MNGAGFAKLIVAEASSMVEIALAQIISRAKDYECEGVPNISEEDRASINTKRIERFKTIIGIIKKYEVLDDLGADIYDDLFKLRDNWIKLGLGEVAAYSDTARDWVLGLSVKTLSHLSVRFARPGDLGSNPATLNIPLGRDRC